MLLKRRLYRIDGIDVIAATTSEALHTWARVLEHIYGDPVARETTRSGPRKIEAICDNVYEVADDEMILVTEELR